MTRIVDPRLAAASRRVRPEHREKAQTEARRRTQDASSGGSSGSAFAAREWKWLVELSQQTDALKATKRYRDWLRATSWHWRYSPMNCALIHIQRPGATKVAGRKDWERRGRALKPDAPAIWILAPAGGHRYLGVCVFDLGDTDGPPLKVNGWTLKGGSRVLGKVEGAAALLDITVREDPTHRGLLGHTLPGKVVSIAAGLSPAERTATLIHEYGHALLGHADGKARGRRVEEAEAEGVAWIVSKGLGVRSKAPQYLAHLGITAVELKRSFRRIAWTARDILAAIHGRRPKQRALSAEENQEQQLEPVRQMLQQALMKRQ